MQPDSSSFVTISIAQEEWGYLAGMIHGRQSLSQGMIGQIVIEFAIGARTTDVAHLFANFGQAESSPRSLGPKL